MAESEVAEDDIADAALAVSGEGDELADGWRKLVMTSDSAQPGPRYRLTYVKTGDNDLKLTFEIAPPEAPEKFKTYIEASAKRAKK